MGFHPCFPMYRPNCGRCFLRNIVGANREYMKRALISVWDKTGLEELALMLHGGGVELVCTGGTAEYIEAQGVPVTPVETITAQGSLMDGRLKTLDARIFGAILADRAKADHLTALESLGQAPIDLVVVNLYPFKAKQAEGLDRDKLVEYIDIGGPSLLRAAAKNHRHVVTLCDPVQYPRFQQLYTEGKGQFPEGYRSEMAAAVFRLTSAYDGQIGRSLGPAEGDLPARLTIAADLAQALRYGENPHQRAGFYLASGQALPWRALHGKALSYNNYNDLETAVQVLAEFDQPAAVIVKHANPCGFAVGDAPEQAYRRALSTDPVSSFGGIVGFNRPVDEAAADALSEIFLECIISPSFEPAALAVLTRKKNLRLLEGSAAPEEPPLWDVRSVAGGYLVQERDGGSNEEAWEVVSKREPSAVEMQSMRLGWKMVKFVKSNAVVLAGRDRVLGVGAGQMSRVDAVILAGLKAARADLNLSGAAMASDGFFPFPDGVAEAAKLGVTAVIQPGGSVRDEEVIATADEYNLAMLMTHTRHFRH